MADLAYPLINGVRHDFSSIEFKLAGRIYVGFKSLDHSRKRTRGLIEGNHPDPIAKTRGSNAYAASCEMFLAEWNLFRNDLVLLATARGIGWGDVLFLATVIYSSPGFDTQTLRLIGCSVDSIEASQSKSPDGLTRKIDLAPLKIIENDQDDTIPLQAPPTA